LLGSHKSQIDSATRKHREAALNDAAIGCASDSHKHKQLGSGGRRSGKGGDLALAG